MVDIGCQDTEWVGGRYKDILDAVLLRGGPIKATLSVDKQKGVYIGRVSGGFGALRGVPRVVDS